MESKTDVIQWATFRGIDREIQKRFPDLRANDIEASVKDALDSAFSKAVWSSVDTLLREKYT